MSVQVSYKKQFTFFFILLLIILIVVELSVRTIESIEDPCNDWKKETKVFEKYHPELVKQICMDLHAKPEKYDGIRLEPPNYHSPTLNINSDGFRGPEISKEKLQTFDCVIIVTNHDKFDYNLIKKYSKLIIDSRGVYSKYNDKNIIKA